MHDLLDALRLPLTSLASAAAEAHVAAQPRGFSLYAVALPEAELRQVVDGWDVADWDWLRDEVRGLARTAAHPLVRLMADVEFGGALHHEVQAALAEAASLPGWSRERPALVPTAV